MSTRSHSRRKRSHCLLMLPSLGLPALETHSAGEPPAELAGRFETRTAPMVTCGGDADPAGVLPDLIMPAAIMARPSRVGLLISFTFSLTSSLAASGCPVLILRILLTKTFGKIQLEDGTLRPINFAMSATKALQL